MIYSTHKACMLVAFMWGLKPPISYQTLRKYILVNLTLAEIAINSRKIIFKNDSPQDKMILYRGYVCPIQRRFRCAWYMRYTEYTIPLATLGPHLGRLLCASYINHVYCVSKSKRIFYGLDHYNFLFRGKTK